MIRSVFLVSMLWVFASAALAAEQPAADRFVTPPAPVAASAPASAPSPAPAAALAVPPRPAPEAAPTRAPAAVAPKPSPRGGHPMDLFPAKCDAQGRLVIRKYRGSRIVTLARITEKDGAVREIKEVRQVGCGPMMYDTVYDAKDLYVFGVDGNPIDPQTLPARLAQWTPVLCVDLLCVEAPLAVMPAGSLLEAFREDVVIIGNPLGNSPPISERAAKTLPPPPPRPVRVHIDDQGRLVFDPLDYLLSFEFPARNAAVGGSQPRPTGVKAVAPKRDRYALSPELVLVFDSNGQPVDVTSLPRLLTKEATSLVYVSKGPELATSEPPKPFESFYLRAAKAGTLVFVVPFALAPLPLASAPSIASPAPMPQRKAPAPATAQPPTFGQAVKPLRYVGYTVFGPAKLVEEISPYTNVVLDSSWVVSGSEMVEKACAAGLPVVLTFNHTQRKVVEERLLPLFERHRSGILGVCWAGPYYNNVTPEEVAELGQALKQKFPGLQYWVANVEKPRGSHEQRPVPDVVDVIVVDQYYDHTPERVRAKAADCLPNWIGKAKGRPVLLQWMGCGLVPKCAPGTMRACFEVAQKYNLQGVIFHAYGSQGQKSDGIETSRALVTEIREGAREFGRGR